MNLSDLSDLAELAIAAARAAGSIIQAQQDQPVAVEEKTGGDGYASQVVTAVDRACEAAILARLQPSLEAYDLALLSEEREDDGGRLIKPYFWCIDPMDGTLPFIERRPGYSVSIALVARDGTPQLGVVYDPRRDTLYHAVRGHGAFKHGQAWEISPGNDHLTYVTDRKLQDTPRAGEIRVFLEAEAARLGLTAVQELAGAGSVLNAIRVLEQGPACMLKHPKPGQGGGSLWDFAATACIFQELGLPATNLAGGPLDLNRRDSSFMNHEGVWYAHSVERPT